MSFQFLVSAVYEFFRVGVCWFQNHIYFYTKKEIAEIAFVSLTVRAKYPAKNLIFTCSLEEDVKNKKLVVAAAAAVIVRGGREYIESLTFFRVEKR